MDYFNEVKKKYDSSKTYRGSVLIVRDFLRFLDREWANKLKLPKTPRLLPILVREEQIRKLLGSIEDIEDPVKKQRLKAFTILGATTGMRSEEIYKLTQGQIDLKNRSIHVKNTKTSRWDCNRKAGAIGTELREHFQIRHF